MLLELLDDLVLAFSGLHQVRFGSGLAFPIQLNTTRSVRAASFAAYSRQAAGRMGLLGSLGVGSRHDPLRPPGKSKLA